MASHFPAPFQGKKCNPCLRYVLLPMSQAAHYERQISLHANSHALAVAGGLQFEQLGIPAAERDQLPMRALLHQFAIGQN
jgi:hypothetical protein